MTPRWPSALGCCSPGVSPVSDFPLPTTSPQNLQQPLGAAEKGRSQRGCFSSRASLQPNEPALLGVQGDGAWEKRFRGGPSPYGCLLLEGVAVKSVLPCSSWLLAGRRGSLMRVLVGPRYARLLSHEVDVSP